METTEENKTAGAQNTQSAPTQEGNNHMLMSILSYLGPLVIVSLIVAKDDPKVKFHIKQGLLLFIIEILSSVLYSFMPGLYFLINIINLATFVLSILGIINVVNKKEAPLPVIGQYSKHFTF